MFGKLGTPELLLILAVVILIFGAKRLPDMARSLGQSMRILKSETKAMREPEDNATATDPSPAPPAAAGSISPERTLHAMSGTRQATATAPARDVIDPR
ncbi:Sec-independent protein translocase subunit TatA [Actinacidiphila glaucinigra]|uniref:Sec-independent protein translocase subunit TatA n=1 Tax=Actinacidiphila glaucinigra TaxID=235986 RepID=UPI00324FC2A9